jgi:hypothetical protein
VPDRVVARDGTALYYDGRAIRSSPQQLIAIGAAAAAAARARRRRRRRRAAAAAARAAPVRSAETPIFPFASAFFS